MSGPSDFNDLHVALGIDAVRDQLRAGLVAANEPPAPSADDLAPPWGGDDLPPPAPPDLDGRVTLAEALERFVLAMPDGKVWDAHDKKLLKKTAAKDFLGKKLFEEWLNHDGRRSVHQDLVKPLAASAAGQGGGGLARALSRYVYLYPTDAAWDREKRQRVPLSALRHAIADCFDDWIKHPGRAELDIENLVFDPTQQVDLDTHINTFRGLPLSPRRDDSRCVWQLALLDHLCNGEAAVVEWLVRWLAYPLQHVGAKMASAVLMHSSQQGSGKSLFWEEVIKPMYGEYGSTLGQHQLESQYTAWRSQLLFALFEEVLSRDQKYSHTGTLKHMITGKTQRIEQKFLTGWEESNHMNSVFLSNELQPWPLEPTDRRMLVVWPEKKLPDSLKANVLAELASGGREALLAYLLAVDTTGFSTHSEPPVTEAKQRIIDFGRPGWEVFYLEWRDGYLDAPYMPCLAEDLFALYRAWADKRRENVVSMTKFGGFVGVQEGVKRRRDVHYNDGYRSRKGTFFIPRAPADPWRAREGESQQAWLGRCAVEFAKLAKGDA